MKRFLSLCLVIAVSVPASCVGKTGQVSEKPAKADPVTHAATTHETPHWTYEGGAGPSNWAALSGEWSLCGSARTQSPIDIDKTVSKKGMAALKTMFKPASLHVVHHAHVADGINNGHTIQVNYPDGSLLTIGGKQYDLVQLHFHTPSEHTVKGEHYPIEMHLVHKAADNSLAVLGVFVDEGAHNTAFDPIWSNLPRTKGEVVHLENVTVDVNQFLPTSKESYRYDGSLTTPPCSEDVNWIVLATPIAMSAQQINAFRGVIDHNNRPTQPLNGRVVETDVVDSN